MYIRLIATIKYHCQANVRPATCTALTTLGINMYHGEKSIFDNPRDFELWWAALRAKYDGCGRPFGKTEYDQLLGSYQGISDLPAILFADDLIKAYPDAKVILTHRDVDKWYKCASLPII